MGPFPIFPQKFLLTLLLSLAAFGLLCALGAVGWGLYHLIATVAMYAGSAP